MFSWFHTQENTIQTKKDVLTMSPFFTVNQVASRWQYTTETVWKKCRLYEAGDPAGWPHLREGRTIRFTADQVREIEERMTPTQSKRIPKRKRRPLAA